MKRLIPLIILTALTSSPAPWNATAGAAEQLVAGTAASPDTGTSDVRLPQALSLPQALELAVRHSPVIAEARERIREQEGVIIEARAGLMPRFEAVARYDATDPNRIESFGPEATPLDQSWSTEVLVSYTVYNGGRDQANTRAARAAASAAENRMRAVVNTVMLEIALRYFDALLASDRIEVQQQALSVLEEQLGDATNRFEAGTGPQFNVLQAEVALANARPPLVRARSQRRLAIDQLRLAIGLDYADGSDHDQVRLLSQWPDASVRENLAGALAEAIDQRPELTAAAADIEAARERYRAELALTRPQVDLVAGYGVVSESFSSSPTSGMAGWTAGVRVSVPLFDLGRARGRQIQADSRIRQSQLSADQVRLDIEGEVREAWLSLEEAREILDTSQLVVEQATEALRLARSGFEAGTATQLEILQSQLELTRARSEEVEAQHLFHTALSRLRRAMGNP